MELTARRESRVVTNPSSQLRWKFDASCEGVTRLARASWRYLWILEAFHSYRMIRIGNPIVGVEDPASTISIPFGCV
jgi:hypothetical protein